MNILITSVGRRAYMVKYFQDIIGSSGQVHVSNSDDMTVAFQYADKGVVSPNIYDETYIQFLLEYCKDNAINALISLFDIDLLVLAKNKDAFAAIGTRVIVSSFNLVSICNDKWKTYEFLLQNKFNVPKTYLTLQDTLESIKRDELRYPVVVKPRFGCGSIAVSIAEDREELMFYYKKTLMLVEQTYLNYESAAVVDKVIFQGLLRGQEYGADIFNDLDGNFQNVIIKKKLAMRAGETDIAETVEEPGLFSILERLGKLTRHIANLDCDVFMVDGVPFILELNARFGGGYPFSHMAGANFPKAIHHWLDGIQVDHELLCAKSGVLCYKELTLKEAKGR